MSDIPDDPLIITIDDVRKIGFCAGGARRWFEEHSIDFRAFLKQGVPASILLATGDAFAIRVVERKKESLRGRQ